MGELPNLDYLFPHSLSKADGRGLMLEPSEDEVKGVLSSIATDSNPGLDGFGSSFYLACWNFVKDDIMGAVREFFQAMELVVSYSNEFTNSFTFGIAGA